MRNFTPAAGSCGKPWPTWSLPPNRSRPFWTYSSPLVPSRLMSDNPHSATIPHLEHWTVLRRFVMGGQMDRRNHPLLNCLLLQATQHRPAEAGKKLRVKPVEVLEKTNHWHYLQLLTAPETHPAVLSAWTTNFLKAAFQIVVWLVLRHLRHCSP